MNNKEQTDFDQKETWDLNFVNADKDFKKVYIATRVLDTLLCSCNVKHEKLIKKSEEIIEKYLSS